MVVHILFAAAILAATPTPSAVITFSVSGDPYSMGFIEQSTSIPANSQIFETEDEILASISSASASNSLC